MATVESSTGGRLLVLFILVSGFVCVHAWDSVDLELFDIVEEVKDNFYQVLGVETTATQAEIRRAYRRISLQLHPDRNKEDDAELKFRKLVAVAEVLKDEDKRKRYDTILRDGMPDWRQPVYYYRRVRKMGLVEFVILLFFILTIGHYIVAWSIYLEKKFELEEVLSSKMKKEEKKRRKAKSGINEEDITEIADVLVQETGVSKPSFYDLLPFQVYRLVTSLPSRYRSYKQAKEERERLWLEEQLEREAEEQEILERIEQPKKPRRRLHVELPEGGIEGDDSSWGAAPVTNVMAVTGEMTDGSSVAKDDSNTWTEEDTSLLSRAMAKFPGGTPKRWEKISQELGKSLEMVTKQVKKIKQGYTVPGTANATSQGTGNKLVTSRKAAAVTDEIFTRADPGVTALPSKTPSKAVPKQSKEFSISSSLKRNQETLKNPLLDSAITRAQERRENGTEQHGEENSDEATTWSQAQQKLLEIALQQFPKTTPDRWTCIARAVPGMTKEDCINRYKYLVELVRNKKTASSTS
ncbi:dnaJ homolog subfamily C member 1 [Nematostella vectensis]|uniref:dnaJ homolog subfamily C member 1 n=1 Tax=Nematostella vectensis TaxID=45351 RepID=UPI0020774CBC|nr:dnaJ homolog subfamily C member 1 [Nematostella vectensis]